MSSRPATVLHVGQNGQVTIPAPYRKSLAISSGAKILAVPLGDALVLVPHDPIIASVCSRLEQAMKRAGVTVEDLQKQALVERKALGRELYGIQPGKRKATRRR